MTAPSEHERWVDAFAQAWHSPTDADDLVEKFRPLLMSDYRFRQPLSRGHGVGLTQFHRRFARPLLDVLSDVQGTVESWAGRGDTLFIEMVLDARVGRRPIQLRACDRVRLVDGMASDRETYFDPLPLLAAVLRSPQLWVTALRAQVATIGRGATA